MAAFERRTAIIDYLQRRGRASTRELSLQFGVSEVTIRTDLVALQDRGWLARLHGGAELGQRTVDELPFDQRRGQHGLEKVDIARAAAALVQPGDHIVLDSSTTAYQLALQLRSLAPLTVITNNVRVAQVMAENPDQEVVLIGGVVRGDTWSTVGVLAEEMLAKLHGQKAFLGAAGFTPENGFTDADLREVQMKRALVAAAGQVNILLDSSKFGLRALLTFAHLGQVHRVVTDRDLDSAYAGALRSAGLEVIIA